MVIAESAAEGEVSVVSGFGVKNTVPGGISPVIGSHIWKIPFIKILFITLIFQRPGVGFSNLTNISWLPVVNSTIS